MSYCAIVQHRPMRDLPNLLVAMGGGGGGLARRLPVTSFCFPFLIMGECHENGLAFYHIRCCFRPEHEQ